MLLEVSGTSLNLSNLLDLRLLHQGVQADDMKTGYTILARP